MATPIDPDELDDATPGEARLSELPEHARQLIWLGRGVHGSADKGARARVRAALARALAGPLAGPVARALCREVESDTDTECGLRGEP